MSYQFFRHIAATAVSAWTGALLIVLLTLAILPGASAADSAAYTSQVIPTTMFMGKTYAVSITMRNNGTTTWNAAGANAYSLVAQNPAENQVWGIGRVSLTADVKPGTSATFAATITAPTTPGTYNFQWQMRTAAGVWFGALTPNVSIQVGQGTPSATITSPVGPLTMSSSGEPVTLRVTGTSAPNIGGRVSEVDLFDNNNQIALSIGAAPFDKTVSLSAGQVHWLRLRATNGLVEGFSTAVPVTVNATGVITDCAAQLPLSREMTVTGATGQVYGNNTTGYNVGSDLGSALVHAGLMTPGERASVTVTSLGQLSGVTGVTANGITSSDFGAGCGMLLKVGAFKPRPAVSIYKPESDIGVVIAENGTEALVAVTGEAYVSSNPSPIKKIELYDGTKLLATVDGDAFTKSLLLPLGRHQLKLVATNNVGQFGESKTVAVTVTPRVAGDGAQFVTQTAPRKLRPGEPFEATVTMVNTGNTNWDTSVYRLGAVNPENSTLWLPSGRASLSENTTTTRTSVIRIPTRAPTQAGTYNFQWRMVHEPGNWFGETTPNQVVVVEDGPGPTATLIASPTVTQVVDWGTTFITLKGSASSNAGNIRLLELWVDNGNRVDLVDQIANATELNFTRQFGVGVYRWWLRATDANGVKADSDPVIVTITNSQMLGENKGVRTGINGKSELYGWACMPGVHASLNYKVLLDTPFVGSGTLLTSGVANVSTEWDNESVQYRCGFTQTPHHFVVPLDDYIERYSGRRLYVLATSPDAKETLELSCVEGNCLVPGVTRVMMTTPLTGARVTAHADTFLRMVVSNVNVPIDDIGFMVDGDWVPAKPDGAPGAYSANKDFWPTAQNHTVYARIRQSSLTIKSMEQWVKVVEGPLPKAKLAVTPTNTRVTGNGTATLTFVGSGTGSGPNPQISKVEVFQDSGTGYLSAPIKTLSGSAPTVDLSFTSALAAGVYKFKLRATDAAGVQSDSTPVVVNITNSPLLGLTTGVRIDAAGNPKLVGWMCQSGVAAPLTYQLLLDAPTPLAGGSVLTSGTANLAAEPDDAAVQTQCKTPGASHHFAIDLSSYTGLLSGRQLYVYGQTTDGALSVSLPCADNTCTMPGALRVGITTPTNGQSFMLPNPAFLRMKVSDLDGAPITLDEVGFYINGTWIAATAELDAPGAYSVSTPLAASATPYTVQAKVRQGNITLFSVQNRFTVSVAAPGAVSITAPAQATTVAPGETLALSASVNGTPASVKFFANGAQIGVATSGGGGWNYNWTPAAANTYSVLARSYDAGGVQLAESAPVAVTVSSAGSATPLPVTISAPHLGDADIGSLPGDLAVTPAGAATYSLPIVVPPGTAGLQPALSLEYNSSGQNSMVGLGWSLSGFSSIHRCGKTIAQDGENGRISYNSSDRLCLDGQRLVLANRAETDANYWAADAQYRTEIDSFSRISSLMAGGKRSFKVEARNGRIMTYGGATGYVTPVVPARINSGELAPQPVAANKTEAQSWAVDRIEDRSGNYITIAYQQNAVTGEHYAVGIRYGGNGMKAHAGVVIEHQDRPDAWTRYIDETRNDLRTYVTSIKTYVGGDLSGDIAASGALVRTYRLAYERSATSGRSLLASVEGCAYNTQTKKDDCLPKTEFSWGKRVAGRVAGFESKGTWANAPHLMTWNDTFGANHADYFAFSDFENHGYTDALEKRVASPTSAGVAFEAANPNKPGTLQASYRYFHNNGNGFDVYSYRLNTGKNFVVLEVGDFNGDGAPDLLVAAEDGTQICLSPLGKAGALQGAAVPIVFTCDPGRPAVGSNTSVGQPYVIDILGDGRSAHYSHISSLGTATVCIQGACLVDSSPPGTVLASRPQDDGAVWDVHDYTSIDQMVDFAGVGKPYDTRWNRPHYQKYYVDVDGSKTPNPPELTWDNLQPLVTLTGFALPGQPNVARMAPFAYPKYPLPCPAVGCAPYRFEIPTQGGNISADFSGSGYNGLAFGFTETDSSNEIWRYKRADFTVCLSTGRALDCNVRKKYSGTGSYVAVRAIGNFVGDGQPSILTEVPFWQADMSPLGSGKVRMCRLLGDDTTAGQGVADDNMVCEDWSGLTLPRATGSQPGDQIYLMDLLGTGRTQVVYYHAGTIDSQNRWSRNDSWEVFAPIDLAAPGQALDRIHQVTNGMGTVQSVEYADGLATGLVTRTGDTDLASTYPQHLAAVPGKLVRRLSKGNGRKADGTSLVRSVTYRYADGATDVAGRGALGFRTVTTTDEQTGIVTTTKYRHVWPYTGMVQSEIVSAGGVTLSSTTNEFGAKTYRQAGGAGTLYPYVSRSTVTRHDLLGDAFDLGTTTTDNIYDDDGYGNLTSRTVTTVGGGESFLTKTVTEYANDAAAWLIGLPKTVSVTRTNPDQSSLKRTTTYTYGAATGLPESETVEKGTVALEVKTEYVRTGNPFGQVNRTTQTWTDPVDGVVRSRDVTSTTYDANGRFPVDVSNAMGHKENHGTDPATGARISHKDANGLVTTWTVDGFGRVGKELRPDGNETRISNTKKCAADCRLGAPVVQVSETYHGDVRISAPTVVYSDDVGHVLSTQSWGFKGDAVYADRDYDSLGRPERTLQPAFANGPQAYLAMRQEYDILNRVTKSVTLDDNNTERAATTEYQGMTRVLTNALTYKRTEQYNAIGQVKKVTDAKLGVTQFAYEPFGNLAKTIDPRLNVIDVGYDLLGRRLQLTDPDLGIIRYTVDPLGRVVAQSNPELRARTDGNTSVKMVYDKLDRMTSRVEPELKSYWVYDTAAQGVGQLAEAYTMAGTSKDYRRVHTYDVFGRASAVTQLIGTGGTSYVATPVYDIWSRPAGQRYKRGADAEKVFELRYNDKGHLASVVREGLVLWTVSEQDAANRPTTLKFGNATTQTLVYYPTSGRLQSTQLVGASQNQLLQEGYGYDAIGSVLQRTQAWNGPSFTENFHYDELGRLDRSAIGAAEKLIAYYADGSIKSKSGVGGADYRYPAQGAGSKLPHAVIGFAGAADSFSYDLNGNLKTGMGRSVNWTTFDMPSSITKGASTVSFVYGPEHQRTRQDRGADGTVYAGGQEVETNGGEVKVKTYWPLGIGVEIDTVGKGTALYWIHKDRLGSPVAIADQNGVLQDPLAYDAWGKRRSQDGASTDDAIAGKVDNKGFTGHEMLDTVDLVHMNGRVYDPQLARFLSPDPYVTEPFNGQNFNRYSYVYNNPTNLVDPTGFKADCSEPTVICRPVSAAPAAGLLLTTTSRAATAGGRATAKMGGHAIKTGIKVVATTAARAFVVVAAATAPGNLFQKNTEDAEMAALQARAKARAERALRKDGDGGSDSAADGEKGTNKDEGKKGPKPPKEIQDITNPPQAPVIPPDWESKPGRNGGEVYYPPGTNPADGEHIRVMPPGSSPLPGMEDGYWRWVNGNKQPIDPSTGKPGSAGQTHIPLPPDSLPPPRQ